MGTFTSPDFLQNSSGHFKHKDSLSHKKKALVVDDEPECRKILINFLKQQGYECEEVGNAFEAMSWFEHSHANLVTTDIHQGWCMEEEGERIPRPTGIELVEYLAKRSGPKPSTIIIVSGNMHYRPAYSERARKAGAKGLLEKPLDKNGFLALL